jgi:hypothetical protein
MPRSVAGEPWRRSRSGQIVSNILVSDTGEVRPNGLIDVVIHLTAP